MNDASGNERPRNAAPRTLWFVAAFAPNVLTPIIILAVTSGRLDFVGGKKDLFFPHLWGAWALLYTAVMLLFWHREVRLRSSVILAADLSIIATGSFVIFFPLLFFALGGSR